MPVRPADHTLASKIIGGAQWFSLTEMHDSASSLMIRARKAG